MFESLGTKEKCRQAVSDKLREATGLVALVYIEFIKMQYNVIYMVNSRA